MKTDSNHDHDSVQKALREWQVNTPLPPRFQESVWQRIEAAEVRKEAIFGSPFQDWLQSFASRRAVAASYLAVLLAAGLVGHWHGRQKGERLASRLSREYIQSVDPYQMPRR